LVMSFDIVNSPAAQKLAPQFFYEGKLLVL
jgi:hypothetical protein